MKTVWVVVFFAVFGALAYFVHWLFFDGEPEEHTPVAAAEPMGPLPSHAKPRPESVEETAVRQPGEKMGPPHQMIEEGSGSPMSAFYRGLSELEKGDREKVRIVHYGDSILTTDELSGKTRQLLQERFGDGGHGFVLLGKPWRWYHHVGVDHGAKGKWRARPLTSDPVSDGLYGLGGVAFEAQLGSHGRAWVGPLKNGEPTSKVSGYDVSYLLQPGGGSFMLELGGKPARRVETDSPQVKVVHELVETNSPHQSLVVEFNNDGKLRIFGAILENEDKGIVYDSLAINGARASVLGRFDDDHWADELKRRDPALVVIMLGANEGANKFLALKEYQIHLTEVLRELKGAVPDASILVVGPLDQAKKKPNGTLGSKRMPQKLSEAQREVALKEGCAYFDTWTAMGGKGSMGAWFKRGLGGGDFIHPTEHGARKIGSWIAEALIYGFQESEI